MYMCECAFGLIVLDGFKTHYFYTRIANVDDSVTQTGAKLSLSPSPQS